MYNLRLIITTGLVIMKHRMQDCSTAAILLVFAALTKIFSNPREKHGTVICIFMCRR